MTTYLRVAIDEDDFWSNVERCEDNLCWLWRGRIARRGDYGYYGVFLAHRVAYDLAVGPIPLGYVVRHRCDTPPCVRPDHLLVGTAADNIADMVTRGRNRAPNGDRHWNCKISEARLLDLRARFMTGESIVRLAAEFEIDMSHCYKLCAGLKRGRVESVRAKLVHRGSAHAGSKLGDADVAEMKRLRRDGALMKPLAAQFGVSLATAYDVTSGRTWQHIVG